MSPSTPTESERNRKVIQAPVRPTKMTATLYESMALRLRDHLSPFTLSGTTIGEISTWAMGIVKACRERHLPSDLPICLYCEDRSHLLAALLATLAGAPPLIIPHALEPECLRAVQKIVPYRWILANGSHPFPAGTQVLPMDHCAPDEKPLTLVRPETESFAWLFTGGSTGHPRLWAKTPGNLFGEARHLAHLFALGQNDTILPTVAPRHIYGLLGSVLLPFVSGARVMDRTYTYPREIVADLDQDQATILLSVPAHYRAFRTVPTHRGTLRLALSSAAPLAPDDGAFFLETTGLAIHELYGSTETGGIAVRAYHTGGYRWEPFTCLDWKIRDEQLCVRSPFVSPDLPRDEEGFFQTADRAVLSGKGHFQLLGRVDEIVKVGGKRVDLKAVRERLCLIPGVEDAYVLALPQPSVRQAQIVALLVSNRPAGELWAAVRLWQDPYARPRRMCIVKALPLLPNGKIDREWCERLFWFCRRAGTAKCPPPASAVLDRQEKA